MESINIKSSAAHVNDVIDLDDLVDLLLKSLKIIRVLTSIDIFEYCYRKNIKKNFVDANKTEKTTDIF